MMLVAKTSTFILLCPFCSLHAKLYANARLVGQAVSKEKMQSIITDARMNKELNSEDEFYLLANLKCLSIPDEERRVSLLVRSALQELGQNEGCLEPIIRIYLKVPDQPSAFVGEC